MNAFFTALVFFLLSAACKTSTGSSRKPSQDPPPPVDQLSTTNPGPSNTTNAGSTDKTDPIPTPSPSPVPEVPSPPASKPASVPVDAVWSANEKTCTKTDSSSGIRWIACKSHEFMATHQVEKDMTLQVSFTCESLKTFGIALSVNTDQYTLAPNKDPSAKALKVTVRKPVDGAIMVKVNVSSDSFTGIQALKDPCFLRYDLTESN